MKLADRFTSALSRPIIKAFFEATRWSPNRASLPARVADCEIDHSDSTRKILIGKSRYLYNNSPIIHGMIERLVTYIVGNGLTPSPESSDTTFNAAASESWAIWCKYADISSRSNFSTIQRVIVRSLIIDGEIFVLLTKSANNRPRVQLIEAHRIKRIDCDTLGRPVAYVTKGKTDEEDGPKYAAEFVVHFFRPERAGQRRGIPLLASAINTAQDVHEILGFEKAAVKEASTRRGVINTQTGQAPVPTIGRSQRTASGETGKPDAYYREIVGGETLVLKNGEEYTEHVSQRPSTTWQGFIDFLSNTLCFAANMPPSVFLQIKVGGADTRRDLASAQRSVEQWQQDLESGMQQIWEYWAEGDVLASFPQDWRRVTWQFPRAITVDAGRQSQADREDVRVGIMTLSEECGQYGNGWKAHLQQLIAEMRELNPTMTEQQAREAISRRLYGDFQPQPVTNAAK